MSNALAIAAVTATLQSILNAHINDADITGADVTLLPLDKARANRTGNQLNLFLYQVSRSASWANRDMPRQVRPGETATTPLPLNLYYLLTPFGLDDDNLGPYSHVLLGRAMRILHDYPVLNPADIKAAVTSGPLQTLLGASDLDQQIEHVRITLQPTPVEELSKLWTGFASEFRLSTVYEVSVAVIESLRAAKTPPPVLARGAGDKGVLSAASPPPSLDEARPPPPFVAARLGDDLILAGQQLDSDSFLVRFQNALLTTPIDMAPKAGGTASQIVVNLAADPVDLSQWVAGFYTVALVVSHPGLPPYLSNETPLALAPVITVSPLKVAAGDLTLTLTCAPRVRANQRVFLLFGDRQIPATNFDNPVDLGKPTTLTFLVPAASAGAYLVRLRVDGVDSVPVAITPTGPAFDSNQKVTVT